MNEPKILSTVEDLITYLEQFRRDAMVIVNTSNKTGLKLINTSNTNFPEDRVIILNLENNERK